MFEFIEWLSTAFYLQTEVWKTTYKTEEGEQTLDKRERVRRQQNEVFSEQYHGGDAWDSTA